MAEKIICMPPQSFSVEEARTRYPGVPLMKALDLMATERTAAMETAGTLRFGTPVRAVLSEEDSRRPDIQSRRVPF